MNHPHDRLFKATFSDPEVMVSLIEDLFPPDLAGRIDTKTLQITNGSFIDETLEEHFADLVYHCSLNDGSALTIALLLEHKSYPVKYPHFQLLRYMLNHWQQDVLHSQSPVPIVPVIIYHGEAAWSAKSITDQMGKLPDYLRRFIPDFDYLLIDLSKMPDEQLFALRSSFLAVSASLLKYSEREKLRTFVQTRFSELLKFVRFSDLQGFILPVFRYIYEQSNLTGVEIVGIFGKVSVEQGSLAMTMYQYETSIFRREGIEMGRREGVELGRREGVELGRQEGRLEGLSEGRLEGRLEVLKIAVKALHQAGQDIKQIADQFAISVSEVETILKAQ